MVEYAILDEASELYDLHFSSRIQLQNRFVRLGRSLVCSLTLIALHAAAGGLDAPAHSDRDEISQPSEADEKPGPTMNIRGRVYGNYETINLPDPAVNGSRVSDFEIRRADITIGGSLSEDLSYRFKADMGTGELNIQDVTISYDAGPAIISVGQLGPIDELTVPAYREFMEGSAIEDAFAPDNQIGVSVLRENETWTFAAGVFKGAIDPGEAEEGWTYASRVTFAPQLPEGRLLHLGGYLSWRRGEEGEAIYGYSARSLLRTGERYVDTDAIADEDMLFGMELAGSIGSVSLESQCAVVRASVVSQPESTSHFDGCYAA